MDCCSITKNLFSLNLRGTEDDETVISRSIDCLYSILVSNKENPTIRYQASENAQITQKIAIGLNNFNY